MNAIVCTKYGPPEVLQLQKIAKPTPKEDGVLVKVHAASVNSADATMSRGEPFLARLWYSAGFRNLVYQLIARMPKTGIGGTKSRKSNGLADGYPFFHSPIKPTINPLNNTFGV